MFTENNSTAQAVIQIASPLAMILTLLVAISSASLGAFVSWWANSRAMRRAKDELSQVRTVRQSALTVRQQALQERERAARELQSRTRENEKTQSEVQILRHQLSQAQTALRASESQRIEHITTITALNAQLKEYRARQRITQCRRQPAGHFHRTFTSFATAKRAHDRNRSAHQWRTAATPRFHRHTTAHAIALAHRCRAATCPIPNLF